MLRRFLADFAEGAAFLRIPEFRGGAQDVSRSLPGRRCFPSPRGWTGRPRAWPRRIALGYRDFRREQRLMTYADQIAWCRRLLDSPAILEELRGRDWIVLLDEAQDTDAAMFAILSEVTRPPGAPVGEWPAEPAAAGPRPGRFCFVGDEQQSIFASRANLGVYRKYIEAFDAGLGGERLEFSVTMRCPRRVIGVVNAIFFEGGPASADPLLFSRAASETRLPRWAPPGCCPSSRLPGSSPRSRPPFARNAARWPPSSAGRGPSGLRSGKMERRRHPLPAQGVAARSAEIFIEAGLPCRLISQQRLQIELPERSWPAALLHVLLNPWDRFELLGVLRGIVCRLGCRTGGCPGGQRSIHILVRHADSPRASPPPSPCCANSTPHRPPAR